MTKKQIIKKILITTLWIAIGGGTAVLLVAAIQKKDEQKCTSIDINIKGVSDNFFVDKKDIINTIISISGKNPVGEPVGSFNLKEIETALQKNVWIKNAQLFFDNNEQLRVNVLEREPVARVFTATGATFYIDNSVTMLPLSEKFSARLPVFTNFPSDKRVLLKADSNLLRDILTIAMAIREDSFYMAIIDQIDISAQRTFEMIPKFGNTIIVFGDAKNAAEKFGKLQLFYKEIMVKAGWNKYSEINVQYQNQVVAKRKGAGEIKADSLKTLQLMKMIAESSERLAGDSLQMIIPDNEQNTTNNNIIQQSIERDDNNASANTNEEPKPQAGVENEKSILPVIENPTVPRPVTSSPDTRKTAGQKTAGVT
ncbi:MAG: FtsQ-type POTRA domain-containing protein [Ferruginibacter sp.]